MISERVVAIGVRQLELVHRPGMDPRTFVRRLIEAVLPALTHEVFAWVNRSNEPAILFFDASALEPDVLLPVFAGALVAPVLVPVVPSAGRTVADCVLAQKPEELRRLLYAANGERFMQSLSENPL